MNSIRRGTQRIILKMALSSLSLWIDYMLIVSAQTIINGIKEELFLSFISKDTDRYGR